MNYEKIYYSIIEIAKNRQLHKDVYTEKHHIIPKSLGGSDEPHNIVKLTAKEHYICHHLLYKFKNGKDKFKMAHAWFRMCQKSPNQKRQITPHQYEKAKIAHREAVSKHMKGRKLSSEELKRRKENNPNKRECIINEIKFESVKQAADHFNTIPHRIRQFERGKLPYKWLVDEEYRHEYNRNIKSKAVKGKHNPTKGKSYEEIYGKEKGLQLKEEKKKINLGKHFSKETKQKMSESQKGRTAWNKGLNYSEKTKQKISESKKGKPSNRLKYIVIKPNNEVIHIDENVGLRQWLRNEYNTNISTAIKTSLKNNEPVKKGKWRGWKFYAMPRM